MPLKNNMFNRRRTYRRKLSRANKQRYYYVWGDQNLRKKGRTWKEFLKTKSIY